MIKLRPLKSLLLAAAWLTLLLASCGSDGTFRLNGQIEGYGTGNLRIVYMHRGTLQNVTATAVDGKFSMSGRISGPVLARLYTGNGRLVGTFIADEGETIDARFNLAKPSGTELDGNDDSEILTKFIRDNAASIDNADSNTLNAAIADYVRRNPGRYASGALLASWFHTPGHEAETLELIGLLSDDVAAATSLRGLADMLSPMAIPTDSLSMGRLRVFAAADSGLTFDPAAAPVNLLMLMRADVRLSDSVKATLGRLAPLAKAGRLAAIDISADPDTVTWQTSLRQLAKADSLNRKKTFPLRAWTPAPYCIYGMQRIPVASLPWFVVADSAGRVLYRGSSLSAAAAVLSPPSPATKP